MQEGRFLASKRAFLHINETPSLSANNSIHSPLHSERGRGRGFPLSANNSFHSPLHSERGRGRGFPLSANNSLHSPLHSERGRGRGCFLPLNEPYKRLRLRLLYTPQHQFYLPHDRSHTPFSILLSHHPLA